MKKKEQGLCQSVWAYLYNSPLKNIDSCGPMTVTTEGAIRLDAEKTPQMMAMLKVTDNRTVNAYRKGQRVDSPAHGQNA